jgi:nitrogen regulatory protein PII
MKQVTAYIKPQRLNELTLRLHEIDGLTGMSVLDVRGFGRGKAKDAPHRIVDDLVDYIPHLKIEIVCRDELVEPVVGTIVDAAHTGLRGDGKIYVSEVLTAVRISTGERGEEAV